MKQFLFKLMFFCLLYFSNTCFGQDTIITTNLSVYYGKILNEDSSRVVLNRKINNDSLKQFFYSNEILQIKYANGEIKFFESRIINAGSKQKNQINTNTQINPNCNFIRLKLKKTENYTFILSNGDSIHATLLKYSSLNFEVALESGKIILIARNKIIDCLPYDFNFNEDRIIPITEDDFLLNHKIYNHFEINKFLTSVNDIEIKLLAKKARKKLITSKILLFTGIAPASVVVGGFVILYINALDFDQSVSETGATVFGSGVVATLPFVISGVLSNKKGKNLNNGAIKLYNQKQNHNKY